MTESNSQPASPDDQALPFGAAQLAADQPEGGTAVEDAVAADGFTILDGGTEPTAEELEAEEAERVEAEEADAKAKKKGRPRQPKMIISELADKIEEDAQLSHRIMWDVHEGCAWRMNTLPGEEWREPGRFDDRDRACVYAYVQECVSPTATVQDLDLALSVMLSRELNQLDRIKDTFNALPRMRTSNGYRFEISRNYGHTWEPMGDAERTAGRLLVKYLGAEDSNYTREVECLILREIVARAYHPGCKADYMLVLTGPQGIGKSTFCRALAVDDQFFLDDFKDFKSDDSIRKLRGRTVVEISELDALNRSAMSTVKSVLTTQVDTLREPYARHPTEHPRSCVFIGTTNEEHFLTDATGNRRFLPVRCHGEAGKLNDAFRYGDLQADVELALAEMIMEYRADEDAFLNSLVPPVTVYAEMRRQQETYSIEDTDQAEVDAFAEKLKPGERVNVKRMFIEGFDYDNVRFTAERKARKTDIANAMSRSRYLEVMPGKQRVTSEGFPGETTDWGQSRAWKRVSVPEDDDAEDAGTRS